MSTQRKLAITGYRGIWGESLNEQIAFEYVRSFARFIKENGGRRILLSRDTRKSGSVILKIAIEALTKEGLDFVYAGIIPTPSVLLLVRKLNLDAGVMITASHNPIEYNGIKFIMRGGRMINESEVILIEKSRVNLKNEEKVPGNSVVNEPEIDNKEFREIHLNEILNNIDVAQIRGKKFRVVLDSINGTGAIIGRELLEKLGCEVHMLNETQDGNFSHMPEPLPENLAELGKKVRGVDANIGFAQDPDADRLVVVNEKGEVVSEEYTLALALKDILAHKKGKIVINIQTSRMNEEIAKSYGQELIYSKVGEGNLIEKMTEINALIGGEGGGGAIYPKINTARDSLVGMGLILELLAKENKKVSEIIATIPFFFSKKEKFPVLEDLERVYTRLKEVFKDAKLDNLDGLCFTWEDGAWISIRPSTTEPLIRVIGEAKTKERIEDLFTKARLTLEQK